MDDELRWGGWLDGVALLAGERCGRLRHRVGGVGASGPSPRPVSASKPTAAVGASASATASTSSRAGKPRPSAPAPRHEHSKPAPSRPASARQSATRSAPRSASRGSDAAPAETTHARPPASKPSRPGASGDRPRATGHSKARPAAPAQLEEVRRRTDQRLDRREQALRIGLRESSSTTERRQVSSALRDVGNQRERLQFKRDAAEHRTGSLSAWASSDAQRGLQQRTSADESARYGELLLRQSLETLASTPSGRALLAEAKDDANIRIADNASYEQEFGGTVGVARGHGDHALEVLLPVSSVADSRLGAVVLAHELTHNEDRVNGRLEENSAPASRSMAGVAMYANAVRHAVLSLGADPRGSIRDATEVHVVMPRAQSEARAFVAARQAADELGLEDLGALGIADLATAPDGTRRSEDDVLEAVFRHPGYRERYDLGDR